MRDDPDVLMAAARNALANGQEDALVGRLEAAARVACNHARLWQWTGLLYRALDEHEQALDAFAEAANADPDDALIAHGRARVALEAGLDARALFDTALGLGPGGEVILGRAAARFAMGEGEAAAGELAALLDRNPRWIQGHVQWAQLAAMTGQATNATMTIDRAIKLEPGNPALWQAAIDILTKANRHDQAWRRADAAIAATGDVASFALSRAAALSDAGEADLAAAAFASLGDPNHIGHAIGLARHAIRVNDGARLAMLTEHWMDGDSAHLFWPYASIAWRQAGDPRATWLERDERLVLITDLTPQLPPLDRLADKLRDLHSRSGRFLDQSVRGGTQTDGPLLSRLDPEIRALRTAIVGAVDAYRAQLPPVDAVHPMLRYRRDAPVRFAGSWSVRLAGAGHHSNHVHPQGWISSAFYVALPDRLDGESGWLTLGEPQVELGTGLAPMHRIEPKAGHLVLFPSMLWHGTVPFDAGERLSVAFDVAPPR